MMRTSLNQPVVALSVKIYQVFLIAYPTKFRQEYGSHMMQVFQDSCLRVVRRDGTNGMFKFWVLTLLDLIQSVISEHTQKETQMKREMKPEDIRRAGWALILGAISFVFGIFLAITEYNNGNWSLVAMLSLVFVSLPLFVFGVVGLRNRYGEKVGRFGKNILLAGAILGPLTSVIGFFLMAMEPYWFVVYTGHAVLFACLTLFGVAALYTKPMPRWNELPVLAGLSYPAVILLYVITSVRQGDWSSSGMPGAVIMLLIALQGIALIALGTILKADVPEEKLVIA